MSKILGIGNYPRKSFQMLARKRLFNAHASERTLNDEAPINNN